MVAAVVIDNGSHMTKAGLAGQDTPSAVFPTLTGNPKYGGGMFGTQEDISYAGHEAQAKRGLLKLKYPVSLGVIHDWEEMEKIWHHTFYKELQVVPEEHPVLLTGLRNPGGHHDRMAQIMFETFRLPHLYIGSEAELVMFASSCKTGVVVTSGHELSYAVPIHEGSAIPGAAMGLPVAGSNVTSYLGKLLVANGYSFTTSVEAEIIQAIKEKECYVATDFKKEMATFSSQKNYEISDGEILTFGKECFQCTEVLFQPSLAGIEQGGIHQLTNGSIMKCDPAILKDLYADIVLSGGNTMLPGFADRMQQEIAALAPSSMEVNVIAAPERKHSAWLGGAKLASTPEFKQMCVSKQEYEESGSSIVNQKFS